MNFKKCSICNIKPNVMECVPSQYYVICPKCGKLTQKIVAVSYDTIKEEIITNWNDIN